MKVQSNILVIKFADFTLLEIFFEFLKNFVLYFRCGFLFSSYGHWFRRFKPWRHEDQTAILHAKLSFGKEHRRLLNSRDPQVNIKQINTKSFWDFLERRLTTLRTNIKLLIEAGIKRTISCNFYGKSQEPQFVLGLKNQFPL